MAYGRYGVGRFSRTQPFSTNVSNVTPLSLSLVDAKACRWRLDHVSDYEKSRPWMESAADLVVDATNLPAADVAERIAKEAEKRIAETKLARG